MNQESAIATTSNLPHDHDIEVEVSFPLAKEPYEHKDEPEITFVQILQQSLTAFRITPEPNTKYYLTHDGKPVVPDAQLGSVAGKHQEVHLRLVKELIQG